MASGVHSDETKRIRLCECDGSSFLPFFVVESRMRTGGRAAVFSPLFFLLGEDGLAAGSAMTGGGSGAATTGSFVAVLDLRLGLVVAAGGGGEFEGGAPEEGFLPEDDLAIMHVSYFDAGGKAQG